MSEKAIIVTVLLVIFLFCGAGCIFFIHKEDVYCAQHEDNASRANLYKMGSGPLGAIALVALLFLIEYLVSQSSLSVYYQNQIFYYLPRILYGALLVVCLPYLLILLAPMIRDQAVQSHDGIKFIENEASAHPNAKIYKKDRKVFWKYLIIFWLCMLVLQGIVTVLLKSDKELHAGLALTLVGTAILWYVNCIDEKRPLLLADDGLYAWDQGRFQWFSYTDVAFAEAKRGIGKGIILHCGSAGEIHITAAYVHSDLLFQDLMERLQKANPKVNISKNVSDFLKK